MHWRVHHQHLLPPKKNPIRVRSQKKKERAEREGTRTVTQDTPKEENDLHEVKAQAIARYYKVLSLHISRRQGITLGFHPEKTGNQIKSPSMG